MPSSYPSGLDTSFPGWPYVDDIEYVTAEQANAWVAAIQAIETTVGYGLSAANPLYSATYGQTFGSLASRLSYIEENETASNIQIDRAAGDIQPIGTTAQAGSTGKAADAGHVHVGVSNVGLLPVGSITLWAGSSGSVPTGYLVCNGQNVSQATYNALYSLIGNAYNSGGTPAGYFSLPNFTDRFPVGAGGSISSGIGGTGGSTTITVSQMPSHSHSANVSDPGHYHSFGGSVGNHTHSVPDPGHSHTAASVGSSSDSGHIHPTYLYETGTTNQGVVSMPTTTGNVYAIPYTGNAGAGALLVEEVNDHWQLADAVITTTVTTSVYSATTGISNTGSASAGSVSGLTSSGTTGISVSTSPAGSGQPYTPPFIGVYFIIKAE
jgi:microcystin-dependent protein